MKFLCYVHERTKLSEVRDFLASKGIPTEFTHRRFADVDPIALFVCVNAQYADAVAVLKDPSSKVTHPVDAQLWSRAVSLSGLNIVLKNAIILLIIVLAISGIVLAAHFL